MSFNLNSIPSYATITACSINFFSGQECGNTDGVFVFTKLRFDFPTLAVQTVYGLIGSGTSITTQTINDVKQYQVILSGLVSDIQSAIQSAYKYIGLGCYNQRESNYGGSNFDSPVLYITYTIPTPSAPTNLVISEITSGSCTLSWTASNGPVTGYLVYFNGQYYTTTSSTSVHLCNLSPNEYLQFYVIAHNDYGNSPQSSTATGYTLNSNISSSSGIPGLLCSSESYTVSNVPSGTTVTWSCASPVSMVSDSHANPCTFQKSSNGNGSISVNISSGCENYNLSIPVHTGPYSSSDYPISGPSSASCRSYVYYSIPSLPGATTINWSYPGSWTYVSGQGTTSLALQTGSSGSGGTVMVGVNNTCGQSGSYATKYTSVYGSCFLKLLVSPNPASQEVTVTIPDNYSESTLDDGATNQVVQTVENTSSKPIVYKVTVMDSSGNVYISVTKNSKSFTIPIQNLKNGNYVITVIEGGNIYTSPLIILHQ